MGHGYVSIITDKERRWFVCLELKLNLKHGVKKIKREPFNLLVKRNCFVLSSCRYRDADAN